MKTLVVYPAKCTGCHRCEMWCSLKNEGVINPSRARIHVLRREPSYDVPVVCLHCGICVSSCSFQAISRNKKTGAIFIDKEKCRNCGQCMVSCPYGMITYSGLDKKIVKCDLCGGSPECVNHCKEGAILYEDYAQAASQRRETTARNNQAPGLHPGSASNLRLE